MIGIYISSIADMEKALDHIMKTIPDAKWQSGQLPNEYTPQIRNVTLRIKKGNILSWEPRYYKLGKNHTVYITVESFINTSNPCEGK